MFVLACLSEETWLACVCGISSAVLFILSIICICGFILVEPGQARVLLFFGKYRGTFTQPGYYWLNPFISQKKLSLRVRNLDAEPIKVNDKTGNPIMIGMVLVWKLKDTYKAIFEIDTQTMAEGSVGQAGVGASAAQVMNMLGRFVQIQADAALRQVAGQYAYDGEDGIAETERRGSSRAGRRQEGCHGQQPARSALWRRHRPACGEYGNIESLTAWLKKRQLQKVLYYASIRKR